MKAKILQAIRQYFQLKANWKIRNNSMYNSKIKKDESI